MYGTYICMYGTYICMYGTYICMYVHTYVRMCMYVCIYVGMDIIIGNDAMSHTLRAQKKNAEGSGDCAYNISFHSSCIDGEAYFVCTAYETIVNMRLNLRLINSA